MEIHITNPTRQVLRDLAKIAITLELIQADHSLGTFYITSRASQMAYELIPISDTDRDEYERILEEQKNQVPSPISLKANAKKT